MDRAAANEPGGAREKKTVEGGDDGSLSDSQKEANTNGKAGNGNQDNDNDESQSDEDSEDEDNRQDSPSSSDNSRNNESASDGDSSGDDNDDKVSKGDDGLSEYERLRLERIKRNRERLIQLGLESKDGGGVLGKKKKRAQPKKRRTSVSSTDAPKRRSRRSSAGAVVSYADPPTSVRSMLGESANISSNPSANIGAVPGEESTGRTGARKEKVRQDRVPRFIYDEFKGLKRHKKDMLKQAEMFFRRSETELRYWQKKAEVMEKKVEREKECERLEEQKEFLGGTPKEFLQDLERRIPEITANVQIYDNKEKVSLLCLRKDETATSLVFVVSLCGRAHSCKLFFYKCVDPKREE
jgi:hypothetical protein